MSYYSRNSEVETRSRERDSHYKRNRRGRDRSWNREKERPRTSFRGRDSDHSDRGDHRRYRPPSRDDKIVLIRRDRERDEDRKQRRTPKENLNHKEIKPTHHESVSILRSPIPEKNKYQRPKLKEDQRQRENSRLPDSITQSADEVSRSHNVASKSSVSVKEEKLDPIIPHIGIDRKEGLPKSNFPIKQVTINSSKTHPVLDRKEFGSKFTLPKNEGKYNQASIFSAVYKEDKKLTSQEKELVEKCFSSCKIRGDYDKIRRECMLDIDTKPAFINARAKVIDITEKYLQKARYHPQMDRAKLRENLKKSFELSSGFEAGLESLVNQILLPKISNVVRPIVEAEVHRCLGIGTPADNNSKGKDEQQSQTINVFANMDYPKTNGESGQATTCSYSCLPPMNVIMDAEPVSTSSKRARGLLGNYLDKQLHEDIQEELNQEHTESLRPRFEVKFSQETMKKTEERSSDDHGEDMERQKMYGDVNNANGNVETENKSNESSNPNVELDVRENLNDCITVNTKTGATEDERIEYSVVNDTEMQVDTNELVVKEIDQSIPPTNDETVMNSDDDMEDDSDDESPEFEKIGEVSPVRIDFIPDFEMSNCDTLVPQLVDQPCPSIESIVKPESTKNVDIIKKSECVSRPVQSDRTVCKFLLPNDLKNFRHKMLFFNCVDKLE